MGIIRDGFVVLRNWATAINKLPEENQLECYKALAEYGLTGKRPENMSPVVDAMIESFSVGMENAIERYNASVENGKKGGAPLGNQNARKNVDKSTENNPNQPKTTTIDFGNNQNNQNQPKTSKNNPNVNVNDNVNVFSQSKNKLINNCAGARVSEKSEKERFMLKQRYASFWRYGLSEERDAIGNEMIDTILEASRQAYSPERLVYDHVKYDGDDFDKLMNNLSEDDFRKLAWSIETADGIENRPYYILGAIIGKAKESQQKVSSKEIGGKS